MMLRHLMAAVAGVVLGLAVQFGATPAQSEDLNGRCGRCGDGYCATQCGETASSCPKDCGVAY